MSGAMRVDPLRVVFETDARDVYEAACLLDRKNRMESRRALESAAVVIVAFMFIPPATPAHWAMLALCVAVILLLWKYPEIANQRYAQKKQAQCPRYEVLVNEEGVRFYDTQSWEALPFSGRFAAYEGERVIALVFDRNRVVAVPKARIGEEALETLIARLREGLGDSYEKLEPRRAKR